jgi:Sec-independent protein secretion pathway component TatC
MDSLSPQFQLALVLVLVMLLPFVVVMIWRAVRRRALRLEREAMLRGNKIYSDWRKHGSHPPEP